MTAPTSRAGSLSPAATLSAILGLGSSVSLPIGGNLFITELLAPLAALYLVFNTPRVKPVSVWAKCIATALLLGAATMVSKDVLSSEYYDFKVWIRFLFIPIMIMSFSVILSRGLLRPLIFSIFLIVGLGIALALKQQFTQNSDIIRFNVSTPFVWMSLVFADKLKGRSRVIMIPTLALASIVTGIRSLGLMVAIVFIIDILARNLKKTLPVAKVAFSVVTLVTATLVGSTLFHELAISGALGEQLRTKELWQTQGTQGFMSVARPHTAFELKAISAAPILGSGSTPRNPEVAGAFLQLNALQGRDYALRQLTRDEVQTHSLIFDGWIRAGIFSGIGWGLAFIAAITLVFRSIAASRPLGYGTTFLMVYLLWSIPYSPLSPQARILIALSIAIAAQSLADWTKSASQTIPNAR